MSTLALQPATESERPIALTPDFNGMPAELLPLLIWVVWRYEWDGKKRWRKVPYIPVVYNPERMRKAKTNDSTTWRSYADAKKVYLAAPHIFDGVGVVLDGDLIGGDFDHAYDAATDQCSDFAREYLPHTYAEYSVSGTGYHFLAHGTIERARKKDRGEVYDRNSPRFLTMTGRRLPNQPTTIEHCQEAIDRFATVLDNEPGSKRPTRTGTPRPSGRTKSRKQLAAGISEAVRDEARQLYRTQSERLERRFKAAAKREETQWWYAARRDYAGFHTRYPFVGLYDVDGTFDPSQARMATGRAIRGLGFTVPEYAALMTLYFAADRAEMVARWGTKDTWWEELADVWEKAAPAKRGIWQPRTPQAVAKKPKGRASDHGANVERVFQLLQAHRIGEQSVITTAELAAEADMHRVTLAGMLTELRTAKRIATKRLGRYGGLVVTFLDVAIPSALPIETPTAVTPLEETHTHNCVSSENAQTGYSSEVPTLNELAAAYLDLPAPRVENTLFDRETGEIKAKSKPDKPAYRRTAKHFADWITADYGEHYTNDQARAAYKAEQQRRAALAREEWRRLFKRFKAMLADELITFISSGRLVEATEFDHSGMVRDPHYYRTRMECAKRELKWRGLKMPDKPTKEQPVTPRKRATIAQVSVQQLSLPEAPAQSPYHAGYFNEMYTRLKALQPVQP
jgi:hypothetical protein